MGNPSANVIASAEFKTSGTGNQPTNKPTPWTDSSNNPVVGFESDHVKTDSLGASPSTVS
jgi:hypothetical protein